MKSRVKKKQPKHRVFFFFWQSWLQIGLNCDLLLTDTEADPVCQYYCFRSHVAGSRAAGSVPAVMVVAAGGNNHQTGESSSTARLRRLVSRLRFKCGLANIDRDCNNWISPGCGLSWHIYIYIYVCVCTSVIICSIHWLSGASLSHTHTHSQFMNKRRPCLEPHTSSCTLGWLCLHWNSLYWDFPLLIPATFRSLSPVTWNNSSSSSPIKASSGLFQVYKTAISFSKTIYRGPAAAVFHSTPAAIFPGSSPYLLYGCWLYRWNCV